MLKVRMLFLIVVHSLCHLFRYTGFSSPAIADFVPINAITSCLANPVLDFTSTKLGAVTAVLEKKPVRCER